MMTLKFYTTDQVAEMLQVSIYSVREWIKSDQLEAVKVGKHYRISEEQLNKYLASKKTN